MVFTLHVKSDKAVRYKEVAKFKEYIKAYYHAGEMLADRSDLHWSYSLKYMMDGYCRTKLFELGTTEFNWDGFSYKITQSL